VKPHLKSFRILNLIKVHSYGLKRSSRGILETKKHTHFPRRGPLPLPGTLALDDGVVRSFAAPTAAGGSPIMRCTVTFQWHHANDCRLYGQRIRVVWSVNKKLTHKPRTKETLVHCFFAFNNSNSFFVCKITLPRLCSIRIFL
jgi:hypothetical protein